jgi:hypothetical protein
MYAIATLILLITIIKKFTATPGHCSMEANRGHKDKVPHIIDPDTRHR